MSKIHSHQIFAILILSGAWSVICIPEPHGCGQIWGTVAACLIEMLCCLPMLALRENAFRNLMQSQKWLGLIYMIYFLLCGAHGFSQLWEAAPQQLLPASGKMTAAVLIVLTCIYTSSAGLRAAARCAPLVMSLFLISVLVLILGAWKRIDISRIALQGNGFWPGMKQYFALSGELGAAWILCDRARNGRKSAVYSYLLAKAIFCILILFLSITAGGRLISLNGYPFFTLTALSQPLQGQRADALYILVFVMLYVMYTTLQSGITESITEMLYPIREKWTAPASLLLMVLLAWSINQTLLTDLIILLLPVLIFVIPLMLRIHEFSAHVRRKEQSHEAF